MAILPAPRTWVSGDTPTAAMLNDNIRDGWAFLLNPPRCIVYRSTALALSANQYALINWDSEVIDSDGMFSGAAPSRITAQTAGVYDIQLHVRWQAVSDATNRYVMVHLNNNGDVSVAEGDNSTSASRIGGHVDQLLASTTPPQVCHLRFQWHLNATDYIEAQCGQSATGSGNSTQAGPETRFSAVWLGSS